MELEGRVLRRLRKSIQQFQLGDGGGPAYLIAWNREWVLSANDMRGLVDRWFAEEREHSRLLGEALRRLGGVPIRTHWSFTLFCGLRRYLGVGFEMSALLLTEIVSHGYYKMLRRYCPDEPIREMCRLIVRDEAGHIAFHRERVISEGGRHGLCWEAMFRLRGLAAGTVLWVNHRGALRAMGAGDLEFYRRIWRDMGIFVAAVRSGVKKDLEQAEGAGDGRKLAVQ